MKTIVKEYLKVALLTCLVFLNFFIFIITIWWNYRNTTTSLYDFAFLEFNFATVLFIFPYILLIFLYSLLFKINIFSRSIHLIGPLLIFFVFIGAIFGILIPVEFLEDNISPTTTILIFSIIITAMVIFIEKLWLVLCKKYGWNELIISSEEEGTKDTMVFAVLFLVVVVVEEIFLLI